MPSRKLVAILTVVFAAGFDCRASRADASTDSACGDCRPQESPVETKPESELVADPELQKLQSDLQDRLQKQLAELPAIDDSASGAVDGYSRRGDVQMFLGHYAQAVSDYQHMVWLDPSQDASHWRLGIALFFAAQPEAAAKQFDKYHSFDDVDRENGIWRYLSHYRAFGSEKAKAELLRYAKDDRPPFPEVYRLFDDSLTAQQVLQAIGNDLPDRDRQSRLFYSHLYIGMNAVVRKDRKAAATSLGQATKNDWPKTAGYGPNYMWHVGRLQYFDLLKNAATKATPQ